MTVDMQKVNFSSSFAGLGNNETKDFSVSVPSRVMAANSMFITNAQTAITRPTSIAEVQIRYTGLNSNWFWLDGTRIYTDPGGNFTVTSRRYIQDGVLTVSNSILEFSGFGSTLPAFTIDCRGHLYDAPFS